MISKAILDTNNKNVVRPTEINQWKSTSNLVDWYAITTDKSKASFLQFDTENLYPSITSDLLHNSIQFAKEVTTVSNNDIHIQSRKTLLFNEKGVKRYGNEDFDAPMGFYGEAEVCELIGSYLLNKLSRIVDKTFIGLDRDDGMAIIQNPSQIERKRMDVQKCRFKHNYSRRLAYCQFPRCAV